ncbi:TonB-dependent receptor [Cytophagia bacterium CHB2]|nr:TonB-dependent receptor [Cytophagia bacterium CHB2]
MVLRRFLSSALAAVFLPVLLSAGTTGKIKGKVVDRESGEPLPSATVLIVGTSMGAAADLNGEFLILNVPLGVYQVKATFIGYREVTISNVRVNSDLTTEVNFSMPSEALEVAGVSIVAERPLVNQNATNATRIQSYEDFQKIPVRSVNAVIALQPGVVVQDGALFVRGGRNDEVGYYLEGANARDADNGANAVTVIPEALEEFQIQAGGYNAEFGGANAGIIRQTLKSGSNDYHFSLQAESDNVVDRGNKFLGTHSYGYTDYTATLSGPLLNKRLKFFVAAQNTFERDRAARFWKGFDFNHADQYVDEHNFPLIFTNNRDPNLEALVQQRGIHMGDNAIPASSRQQWIGNGTLVFDAKPFIFRLGGSLSWRRQDDLIGPNGNFFGSLAARLFNLERNQLEDLSTGLLNFKVTHLLGSRSFYEVNLNYFDRREVRYDPLLEHNFWAYWDSTGNADVGVTFFNDNLNPWRGGTQTMDIYGFDFNAPGTPANYFKNKRSYLGGSMGFTTQYRNHEIKFGGSYERWTARSFASDAQWARTQLQAARQNPDIYRDALAGDPVAVGAFRTLSGASQALTYGYDTFGNETNLEGPDGARHPYYMSFYAQDKFEARDIVINAGLRFDYFDSKGLVLVDPSDPNVYEPQNDAYQVLSLEQRLAQWYKKPSAKYQVSPRFGIAYPITDKGAIHFSYGHFLQIPSFELLYQNPGFKVPVGGGNYGIYGNADLEPQKTVMYELGLKQQLGETIGIDITAFYRDVRNWVGTSPPIETVGEGGQVNASRTYFIYRNLDYANVRGVTFTLQQFRSRMLTYSIDYTFQVAEGSNSDPGEEFGRRQGNSEPTQFIVPLEWDQRHNVNGTVTFQHSGWAASLLGRYHSGQPYTPSVQRAARTGTSTNLNFARNSRNAPYFMVFDLRLSKSMRLAGWEVALLGNVYNLFDRRNEINVYGDTGRATNSTTFSEARSATIRNNTAEEFLRQPDRFSEPREVQLGLRLSF